MSYTSKYYLCEAEYSCIAYLILLLSSQSILSIDYNTGILPFRPGGDMKYHTHAIILVLSASLALLTACASNTLTATSSALSSSQGAALVQERCTACHDISRVEGSRFSASEWKTVVDQMIARGAQLSPDEETVVVSWLASNYGN